MGTIGMTRRGFGAALGAAAGAALLDTEADAARGRGAGQARACPGMFFSSTRTRTPMGLRRPRARR